MITSVGGSLSVLSGPVESKTTNGILEVGEKFTWTGSYEVTATDMALPMIGVFAITNFATADGSNFDPVEVKAPIDIKVAIISGTVTEDIGNDRSTSNDVPLSNVSITLTDKNGLTIRTTITDSSGFYEFQNVDAGDYFVIEQNPTYYYDVKDQDGGPNLSKISVFGVLGGDEHRNKDFVDELLLIISGNVKEDTNNDDVGDVSLANVVIALLDGNLNVIKTTVTDTSGNYKFDSLVPGKYVVTETNLSGYTDVSDIDSGDLNKVAVDLVSSDSIGNNFVDERLGKITGIVTNNAIVKVPLAGAVITLKNDKGAILATTITTASGQYSFDDLPAGSYTVEETNPTDYPDDVSAYDVTDDTDPTDLVPSIKKSAIPVTLSPGEVDDGNNFVDTLYLTISGNVKEDTNNDDTGDVNLANVPISLLDANDNVIRTTITDSSGNYKFVDLEAGKYSVSETNLHGFSDVKDLDGGDLNKITVNLISTNSEGNDFVDERPSDSPSYQPSAVPSAKPSTSPSRTPSKGSSANPSESPSKVKLLAISGNVKEDTNNDDVGDISLANVVIALLDGNLNVIKTTVTDTSGNYKFDSLVPGKYVVTETNLSGYTDVSDIDSGDLNKVAVDLVSSDSIGNNFVDERLGKITGIVTNNAIVKVPLAGAVITLKTTRCHLATTITTASGQYSFDDLPAGSYTVEETNPTDYPDDVSAYDVTDDTDPTDLVPSIKKSAIPVTLSPGEVDDGNNFVDTLYLTISGNVKEDTNNDDTGDVNLANVPISLLDANDNVIRTTITDSSGNYKFVDLEAGKYIVSETNLNGFSDVKDLDGGDLNKITDNLISTNSEGNDFVDERPSDSPSYQPSAVPSSKPSTSPSRTPSKGSSANTSESPSKVTLLAISGNVKEDTNNDDTGDVNLAGVLIALLDANKDVLRTTVTDSSGDYMFVDVEPGTYFVAETNLEDFTDVWDSDQGANLNLISVVITTADSLNNNFVDEQGQLGQITGIVTNKSDVPLVGVVITLTDNKGTVVATTATSTTGEYAFRDVPPGNYTVVETNPVGYPVDVSAYDVTDDKDPTDLIPSVNKNVINVTVTAGELDDGNKFVDTANFVISGNVKEDTNNDDTGDVNLASVLIALLDANKEVFRTTVTDSSGNYMFVDVEPGTYFVAETNLEGFTDVWDSDQGANLNLISVDITTADSLNNNFVDERGQLGQITGIVTNKSDVPLVGVVITLTDNKGTVVATTATSTTGEYAFRDVPPGNYTVVETNPVGYPVDVSAYDVTDDKDPTDLIPSVNKNVINVTVTAGELDDGNKFVDTATFVISGNVKEDTNNDDTGDVNLASVLIALLNANKDVLRTTVTDSSGNYEFVDVEPGTYFVAETNLEGFTDVWDSDQVANLSLISVVVTTADSLNNNFVDERGLLAQIIGNVTNNNDVPLVGVVLTLVDDKGTVVATTVTSTTGEYAFKDVPPGDYTVVETNPVGYPVDVTKNILNVTVTAGELDSGNNFVDTVNVFASDYCEELSFPGCSLCAPFRSVGKSLLFSFSFFISVCSLVAPDYCDPASSFPTRIQQRTSEFRSNPSALESNGYWFQYLEDKIAGYLLSVDQQAPSPEIFCCVTDVAGLSQCLKDKVFTRDLDGIVIKATNFHSNQGVFVLVNETGTGARSDPLFDLIKKVTTTYADAMAELSQMQATKIIVEEFVGKTLPTEYKFHVVNGSIAAIDIVEGRDGDCPCYAVVDTEWNRLDTFGCFEPGGVGHVDDATSCTAIDFETGKRKAGSIKKDLYTCKEVPAIDQCLFNEMIGIALDLGNRIGVYMRVDMFVAGNKIWVQEYSANHMNGLRNCAAKMDDKGCIDSCFLGRMWNDAGAEFGGIPTAVPDKLVGFAALTPAEQCSLITNVAAPKYASKCA
ncbi:oxidoreductase [Fragilaria crotonensis]|nr:oxidoreductase [Fragilaria crotonensis]